MPDSHDSGKFSTDIGQDVIEAAMRSVDKVKKGGAGEEVPVEVQTESSTAAAPVAADAPASSPPASKEVEELRAQLEFSMAKGRELMDKVKDSHERMLRAVADLDNFKKRANKEREEVQRFGVEKLLKDFLPVMDNLDRALDHAQSGADFQGLRQGVEMTRKLFEDTLGKHGVKSFTAAGKEFDPHLHEAMSQVETDQVPPNRVFQEMVRGYTLHDRLVRPALVSVAKAPAAASAPAPAAESPAPEAGTTEAVTDGREK